MDNRVVVDKALLNGLLFGARKKKQVLSSNGKLINVTTYGAIVEKPFEYETWEKINGEVKWFNKSFDTKAYALGHINFRQNYHVWVTEIIGFQKAYIDLYVFDKNGKLKSLVNLYEAED